ncbi:phosphate ABC transporter substrate-binding protein PstS [Niveibacterium umoris]|uniref:Phosphate-binding protein PstS n=1 Tax=Niveibacterium umoris TaxID=1193620 RepID=A0A840BIB3_9RHOO|nr:phosphate ABC transporter substrate-binding protein PstS [Niveibacterium umoris]MBB4011312.1 phosphate transport system substrate-binding protein [Niveibacterium umoris]
MNRILQTCLAIVAFAALPGLATAAEVTGAGASSPRQVYLKWAAAYGKASGNTIRYQSIGSGGGVKEVAAKSVDFGASDIPLSESELEKRGLLQFPVLIGAAVPFVNLPGVKEGELRLTGPLLADIFRGRITRWDDPRIKEVNSVSLPSMSIIVVHRDDAAGVSFLLTHYLSKVSEEWRGNQGTGTAVQWPTGLGGKGDEGVATFVGRLPGAIGYAEYGYARAKHLASVSLQNRSGAFVVADEKSLSAAAAAAEWEKSAYGEVLSDQAAPDAWPISGASFVLVQKSSEKVGQTIAVLKFFEWSYANGGKLALESGYVPLPPATVTQVSNAWQRIRDAGGKTVSLAQ